MAKVVENLVSAKSVLISGAAGVVTMVIANTLWMAYQLPPRWVALALSFLLGLAAFVAIRQTLGQRILCYLCSSSIIFLVAVGSNRAGMILTGLAEPTAQPSGISIIGGNSGVQGHVLQHLDMSARTRTGGTGRLRPAMMDGNAGSGPVLHAHQGPPPGFPALQRPGLLHGNSASPPPSDVAQAQGSGQKRPLPVSGRKPRFFDRW